MFAFGKRGYVARVAKKTTKSKAAKQLPNRRMRLKRWVLRWIARIAVLGFGFLLLLVLLYAVVPPPTTPYILSEARRLGGVDRQWVPANEIAPVMFRSVVAAEDANFCNHWGFDMAAIRDALDSGGQRGASTISQQVVKNAYLWQGRSWPRKALEAIITPLMEIVWPKRRILEVYLNVAEFDEGVFGIEAASRHYFGIGPEALSGLQAARLAAVLPNPKGRSASKPSNFVRRQAVQISEGAATIRADGRASCFED